ncbi:MAG: hypothetical protein H6559_36470 [Lewinellaceae bacterium]|nr:hypothetical protein [Lewinellaceae bacterium]
MEDLLERIKKIESLILGAKTEGEKQAAIFAKERILKKYPELEIHKNPKEYALYTQDNWHKKLLLAICRKYGVKPYRYYRQKYTTVMVRINEDFLNKVLWKEYLEYSELLGKLVEEITDDLISKIHKHEEEDIIQGNLK